MKSDRTIIEYAPALRRRRVDEAVDLELWAAVGVVVMLVLLDVACILYLLLH